MIDTKEGLQQAVSTPEKEGVQPAVSIEKEKIDKMEGLQPAASMAEKDRQEGALAARCFNPKRKR